VGSTGLQVMLVMHALLVVGLGIPLWHLCFGLYELASIGDPEGSDPTGMNVFLALLLGPTPLLNPLAALNLTRNPRRAKVYLALGGVVAWLQVIASVVMSVAFALIGGLFLLLLILPFGWLVFSWTSAAIRMNPAPPSDEVGRIRRFLRATSIDLAVFSATAAVLVLVAALVWDSMQWKGQQAPRDFDESVAWEKMESAVTEVVPVFEGFEGFASRTLEVEGCAGKYEDGGDYYRYELSYFFTDAVQTDPAVRSEYRLAAREYWLDEGHEVQFDRQNDRGDWSIVVNDEEGLRLAVYEGLGIDDPIELNVQTGCVKRTDTPPCLDPQGGVPPETDQIIGIRCEE
jgi:hypothetical protein